MTDGLHAQSSSSLVRCVIPLSTHKTWAECILKKPGKWMLRNDLVPAAALDQNWNILNVWSILVPVPFKFNDIENTGECRLCPAHSWHPPIQMCPVSHDARARSVSNPDSLQSPRNFAWKCSYIKFAVWTWTSHHLQMSFPEFSWENSVYQYTANLYLVATAGARGLYIYYELALLSFREAAQLFMSHCFPQSLFSQSHFGWTMITQQCEKMSFWG